MRIRNDQAEAFGPDPCVPCQGSGRTSGADVEPAPASVVQAGGSVNSWIVIELRDDHGRPVPQERYRVVLPDGKSVEGALDSRGRVRIEGFDPGSCRVTFPDRDAADWKHS